MGCMVTWAAARLRLACLILQRAANFNPFITMDPLF